MIKNLRIICQGVPVNHRGKEVSTQRISKIPGEKKSPAQTISINPRVKNYLLRDIDKPRDKEECLPKLLTSQPTTNWKKYLPKLEKISIPQPR